jgi:RNA polymerase sigma-70 factor (ECF subfamily)
MDAALRTELSAWMARLADGDREPLSAALARLLPELQRFTTNVLHGHADADDAAQRALLSIFARAHEYEPGRDALAWALGIAAWECRTLLRQRSRRRDDAEMPERVDVDADPEASMIERELIAAIESAVGVLSTDDRAALGFGEIDGSVPAATIRKRRQRALVRLREAWAEMWSRNGAR